MQQEAPIGKGKKRRGEERRREGREGNERKKRKGKGSTWILSTSGLSCLPGALRQ